jgi:hypothetical protein
VYRTNRTVAAILGQKPVQIKHQTAWPDVKTAIQIIGTTLVGD